MDRLLEEGVIISKPALYALLKKYRDTNSVEDRHRKHTPPLSRDRHCRFIDHLLEEDDETTTIKLHEKLVEKFQDECFSCHSEVSSSFTWLGVNYTKVLPTYKGGK